MNSLKPFVVDSRLSSRNPNVSLTLLKNIYNTLLHNKECNDVRSISIIFQSLCRSEGTIKNSPLWHDCILILKKKISDNKLLLRPYHSSMILNATTHMKQHKNYIDDDFIREVMIGITKFKSNCRTTSLSLTFHALTNIDLSIANEYYHDLKFILFKVHPYLKPSDSVIIFNAISHLGWRDPEILKLMKHISAKTIPLSMSYQLGVMAAAHSRLGTLDADCLASICDRAEIVAIHCDAKAISNLLKTFSKFPLTSKTRSASICIASKILPLLAQEESPKKKLKSPIQFKIDNHLSVNVLYSLALLRNSLISNPIVIPEDSSYVKALDCVVPPIGLDVIEKTMEGVISFLTHNVKFISNKNVLDGNSESNALTLEALHLMDEKLADKTAVINIKEDKNKKKETMTEMNSLSENEILHLVSFILPSLVDNNNLSEKKFLPSSNNSNFTFRKEDDFNYAPSTISRTSDKLWKLLDEMICQRMTQILDTLESKSHPNPPLKSLNGQLNSVLDVAQTTNGIIDLSDSSNAEFNSTEIQTEWLDNLLSLLLSTSNFIRPSLDLTNLFNVAISNPELQKNIPSHIMIDLITNICSNDQANKLVPLSHNNVLSHFAWKAVTKNLGTNPSIRDVKYFGKIVEVIGLFNLTQISNKDSVESSDEIWSIFQSNILKMEKLVSPRDRVKLLKGLLLLRGCQDTESIHLNAVMSPKEDQDEYGDPVYPYPIPAVFPPFNSFLFNNISNLLKEMNQTELLLSSILKEEERLDHQILKIPSGNALLKTKNKKFISTAGQIDLQEISRPENRNTFTTSKFPLLSNHNPVARVSSSVLHSEALSRQFELASLMAGCWCDLRIAFSEKGIQTVPVNMFGFLKMKDIVCIKNGLSSSILDSPTSQDTTMLEWVISSTPSDWSCQLKYNSSEVSSPFNASFISSENSKTLMVTPMTLLLASELKMQRLDIIVAETYKAKLRAISYFTENEHMLNNGVNY